MILSFVSLASFSNNALSSRALASRASFSLFIWAISAFILSAVARESAIPFSLSSRDFRIGFQAVAFKIKNRRRKARRFQRNKPKSGVNKSICLKILSDQFVNSARSFIQKLDLSELTSNDWPPAVSPAAKNGVFLAIGLRPGCA